MFNLLKDNLLMQALLMGLQPLSFADGDGGGGDGGNSGDGNGDGGNAGEGTGDGGSLLGDGSGDGGEGNKGGLGDPNLNWFNSLPENLTTHPTVTKFKDKTPADVLNSYVNLESKIGEKGVIKPKEGDPQEIWDKYYQDLGRPEAYDKYDLKDPEQAEFQDAELKDTMMKTAYENGLTQEQFQGLWDKFYDTMGAKVQKSLGDYENHVAETEKQLKLKYGATYDEVVSKAQKVVETIVPEDKRSEFLAKYGNDPLVIETMINASNKLSEDSIGTKGNSVSALTPEQARQEILRIKGDKSHPLYNEFDPLHQNAKEEMESLYKMANPSS